MTRPIFTIYSGSNRLKPLVLLLLMLLHWQMNSFGQSRPAEIPEYRLYLIGDAGNLDAQPVLDMLRESIQTSSMPSGVIFLGDNIYPDGMPPPESKFREEAEAIINAQINVVKNFKGQLFFIPGNHDWDNGKNRGWQRLQEQENYIEAALKDADVFLPSNGCPGPIEIPLNDHLVLVILDTQYFLQKGTKPGRSSSCGAKTPEEAFVQLHDILERNANKKVIVASHHPIYTKGMHGGVVTFKDHLFPLTKLNPNLWLPLPIIGSIFPLYRQLLGSVQDQANLQHKAMVNTINALLVTHKNLVHVSGHEHALQYFAKDNVNYVVSGAGAKQNTTVKQKGASEFAGNYHGYAYLDYYTNGEVWLVFKSPDTENPVVFERRISNTPYPKKFDPDETGPFSLITRDPVRAFASDAFEGSKAKSFFFGKGYRAEWYQNVYAPVFDIGKEKGGLRIIKRGGGNQTKSLRLEAKNGKQYVLRLLEKDATKLIPEQFRSHFVKKIVQEGISGSNPYAAFVVPPLAESVNVYHTNPKLVYIPDDPRLDIYREDFKNKLALFEERPAKDQSDAPYFGNSKKVINTADMIKKLHKDNDNYVDQQAVLRARLLDTFLGDWDRHDDQWRWAQYTTADGKGKYFRPIPRDRDQVFYVSEGLIPTLIGSNWAVPALQGFGPDIRNITGLWSFAVKYFDRSFLTQLDRQAWLQTAQTMQKQLSDEVIEQAIHQWPEEVYQHHGDKIIADLKSRRDKLDKYALQYYDALAKQVDVVGSNKHELFDVVRQDNDTTVVTVYKIHKDGSRDKMIYQRKFITTETKEIHLYGLEGNDIFRVSGEVARGPKIRVIGGVGDDRFTDNSKVGAMQKKWLIYDNHENTEISKGKETRVHTSNKPEVNEYDREAFKYGYLGPIIAVKINQDDGLFLGAGLHFTTQGFRKEPFKSSHKFGVTNAIATSSYSFLYRGEFTDVIGKADFLLNGEIRSPNYVMNFFGYGNDSEYDQARGIDYYRVRFEEFLLDAHFRFDFNDQINLILGSSSRVIKVEPTAERFITNFPENGLDSASVFRRKSWSGLFASFEIDTRDKKVLTSRGIQWYSSFKYYAGLSGGAESYSNFTTDFTFFYSFKQPSRVTLSNRTGFAQVLSDNYEFYQANYLDGHDQLRGFRKYRFAGERMFYNNTDLTVRLLNVRAYILPTQIGFKLFYDIGRVDMAGDSSNKLHQAYGGAIWVAPARVMYLSLLYGRSSEGWFPSFHFGYALN